MDFFAIPDGGPILFLGLALASFATAFIGVFTGTAGGLVLLAIMAVVMPTAAVIPVHTVVQLGAGLTRTMIMWRYVMRQTLPPFWLGEEALNRISEQRFRLMLQLFLTALGLQLLWKAASGAGWF